jgi:enoyl-CoA hydratase
LIPAPVATAPGSDSERFRPLLVQSEESVVDPPSLVTQFANDIAIVRLNKPAQRNSLSLSTLQELDETLRPVFSLGDVKAIIFTGTDDVFASGADIRELTQLDPISALESAKLGQTLFQTIADARQVTIAAINGYCMGGALDLALSCDIRVASKNATFSHPGAKRGIITGWGGTQRLPRIIGKSRALDLFVTARQVRSEEALQMGLVSTVFDPVLNCALQVAASVPTKKNTAPKSSFGAVK